MADQDSSFLNGRGVLGFSMSSPDLVVFSDSPEIPRTRYVDSPKMYESKYRCNVDSPVEISLENGINEEGSKNVKRAPVVRFSSVCQTFERELSPDVSFELVPRVAAGGRVDGRGSAVISVNVGGLEGGVMLDGVNFGKDSCGSGGDSIGDGEGGDLYRTARVGNFAYGFEALELGNYEVDLHFAEIEFTDGPPGVRLFDVFIQDEKVVSSLDIYGRVGANKPLVLPGLKAFVDSSKRLSIRFEQVNWSPICCGILVRKSFFSGIGEIELVEDKGKSQVEESIPDDIDHQTLRSMFERQQKELTEARRALEEIKEDNCLKNKECQDAWKSLRELQNELMRKSMHVGSLAFAIEGQVKEKSKWFSSVRDVTRKLKIMKMDQLELIEEAAAFKNCIAEMDLMRSAISRTINEQVDSYQELKNKFVEGARERKELYNKVLELKGNIRVFCRCRPLNAEEVAAGASIAIDFDSAKDSELIVKSNGFPKKIFKFDAIFGPQADQVDVFEDTAPFASSVLDGYNVCIFAYGQTGTGKTFTMEGIADARGVNFRTLEELFRIIKEREKFYRYDISVSVLEVYNEQIRDLLNSVTPAVPAKRLEIRQVSEGIRHVPGLVEAHVNNINEAWEVLQTGSNARSVGSTNANEHSSRSHCIHCVMVKGENLLSGECIKSKLWLVDLAGSERVAKTEVQGDRLKETQNINRSLSALGDVIAALATKSPHIPFRNSKLTHLLQDSLGGDSKTLMFVQISPNESDLNETLCSLNFASRVRGVELGPPKKQLDMSELIKYKQMVDRAKQEMKSKDMQVQKMEESIHYLELKMKEKDGKNKNLQEKVKELESQLLIERKLARQHVDTKIAEKYQQQQIKQQEDQNTAPVRAPLTNRPLGSWPNSNELAGGASVKEQTNITQLLAEYKYKPSLPVPSMNCVNMFADPIEKENNPIIFEQPMLPKKTGRASLCPAARQIPISSALRRNSLIPLPILSSLAQSTTCEPNKNEHRDECDDNGLSEQIIPEKKNCDSPKAIRSANKRISSILRRSIQKKVQLKSPRQQYPRKGAIGVEKTRLSIGSRGRTVHSRKVGTNQHKQTPQQQKERRWNAGTAVRTII